MSKLQEKCKMKGCFGRVIPIYHREKEDNRSRKVLFYLCKKCSQLQNFRRIPYDNIHSFSAYLVPKADLDRLKIIEQDKSSKIACLYCSLSETIGKEIVEEKIHETGRPLIYKDVLIPAITKLYAVDRTKRPKFAGYMCEPCRVVYFRPDIENINWKTQQVKIDVLLPIREIKVIKIRKDGLQQEERWKKLKNERKRIEAIEKWKSEEQTIREKYSRIMNFDSLGGFTTLHGL